jgi:hypothetical protein
MLWSSHPVDLVGTMLIVANALGMVGGQDMLACERRMSVSRSTTSELGTNHKHATEPRDRIRFKLS